MRAAELSIMNIAGRSPGKRDKWTVVTASLLSVQASSASGRNCVSEPNEVPDLYKSWRISSIRTMMLGGIVDLTSCRTGWLPIYCTRVKCAPHFNTWKVWSGALCKDERYTYPLEFILIFFQGLVRMIRGHNLGSACMEQPRPDTIGRDRSIECRELTVPIYSSHHYRH